jgi:transcriptional regulator with XRE-family HTH domain
VLNYALQYVIIISGEIQVTGGDKMTVGENIKRLRETKNMTQESLAQKLGVTSSNISQIESGERGLSIDKAVLIADALGVSLMDLLEDKEK